MLDFIKNVHKDISKKVSTQYQKHASHLKSKMGDTCIPGDKKCQENLLKKKQEELNQKNKKILEIHSKVEKPNTYSKALDTYYHTGVVNKTNGSICNNNLNNKSFINKYTFAKKNSQSRIDGKEADIHGHFINCSNKCTENFENINDPTSFHRTSNCNKIINIIFISLFIVCLILYLFFFIKQFQGKGKKKY